MSSATASSLRVMVGSIDGTVGGRVREPLKRANDFNLGRYLTDRPRYELIATGHPTTSLSTSPKDDIKKTGNQLRDMMARAPGNGA